MNRFMGIGRITKDAEMRYTSNNKAVTEFTIAVDEGFGDKKKTNFIPIVLWGMENVTQYLTKGTEVGVSGSLQLQSYKDKNGVSRISAKIVADTFGGIKLLGAKRNLENPVEDIQPIEDKDIAF